MSVTPTPPVKPAPAPTPGLKLALSAKLEQEIVVVLGLFTTVGEAVLVSVPSGPVTSVLQIALPAATYLLAHLKTAPARS